MLATAIFRAVENNIDLIRATNSGLSARIDRYGIVSSETPMFQTAVRTWKIKTENEASDNRLPFYALHGDIFAVSCVVISSILLVGSVVTEFAKRKRFRSGD